MIKMILTEGRKEDLYRKFQKEIDVEKEYTSNYDETNPPTGFDYFIEDDFVQQTNFKYLDFLLTVYYFMNFPYENVRSVNNYINSSMNDAATLVNQVKLFDRFPDAFKFKDINEYSKDVSTKYMDTFTSEYNNLLTKVREREEEKRAKKQVEVLYDKDNLLIIKPLSTTASCYYGKTTKWCTSAIGGKNQFQNYAYRGDLYYVIDKNYPERYNNLGKFAVFYDKTNDTTKVYNSADQIISYSELPKKAQEVINTYIQNVKPKPLDNVLKWIRGFNKVSTVYKGSKVVIKDIIMTSTPQIKLLVNDEVYVSIFFNINQETLNFQSSVIPYKIVVTDKDGKLFSYDGNLNVIGDIENIPPSYFLAKIMETIKEHIENDYAFWRAGNAQSTYTFSKPNGTLADKFTKYIISKLNKGKLPTKKEFIEMLFKEQNRELNDYVLNGYLSTFLASIKDAGIVKLNRNASGSPKFYYTLGDNYDKWKQGKLKRV